MIMIREMWYWFHGEILSDLRATELADSIPTRKMSRLTFETSSSRFSKKQHWPPCHGSNKPLEKMTLVPDLLISIPPYLTGEHRCGTWALRRVLVLHLGVWGLTRVRVTLLLVSATVRNRSPPFATVRDRSRVSATVRLRPSWPQSCRAYWKSRKNVTFLTCPRCGYVVLRGRHGTSWHSNMFQDASSKIVSCGRQYSCYIKMCCILRGRRCTLDTSPPISFCLAGATL